ncbi:hypothetical protein HWV62_43188 [Athelia sp. TMB]|nr:hypothetical protein HWV62_43188 [Athelia sp. TMB]
MDDLQTPLSTFSGFKANARLRGAAPVKLSLGDALAPANNAEQRALSSLPLSSGPLGLHNVKPIGSSSAQGSVATIHESGGPPGSRDIRPLPLTDDLRDTISTWSAKPKFTQAASAGSPSSSVMGLGLDAYMHGSGTWPGHRTALLCSGPRQNAPLHSRPYCREEILEAPTPSIEPPRGTKRKSPDEETDPEGPMPKKSRRARKLIGSQAVIEASFNPQITDSSCVLLVLEQAQK